MRAGLFEARKRSVIVGDCMVACLRRLLRTTRTPKNVRRREISQSHRRIYWPARNGSWIYLEFKLEPPWLEVVHEILPGNLHEATMKRCVRTGVWHGSTTPRKWNGSGMVSWYLHIFVQRQWSLDLEASHRIITCLTALSQVKLFTSVPL